MFQSYSQKNDDFDELNVVMDTVVIPSDGIPGDCVLIILDFLNEEDYVVIVNVMTVSKYVRDFLLHRNKMIVGRFVFKVTHPEFLVNRLDLSYVSQMIVNNEKLRTKFTDSMFKYFPRLQKLVILSPGKSIKNSGFKYLTNLRYLEIDCSHTYEIGLTSDFLYSCQTLEKLFLTQIPGKFNFSVLQKLINLEVFYLSGGFVKDSIFKNIPISVIRLRFFQCPNITTSGFREIRKGSLKFLHVRKCIDMNPEVMKDLVHCNHKGAILYYDNSYKEYDEGDFRLAGRIAPERNQKCNIM